MWDLITEINGNSRQNSMEDKQILSKSSPWTAVSDVEGEGMTPALVGSYEGCRYYGRGFEYLSGSLFLRGLGGAVRGILQQTYLKQKLPIYRGNFSHR